MDHESDDTNRDLSPRLPRPRRPPPRHVLRQAGGPEGRGSWSGVNKEQTEEVGKEGRQVGRKQEKKQCEIRKGRRRVELVLSSCSETKSEMYIYYSKQADDEGRGPGPSLLNRPCLRGNGDCCFLLSMV